MAIAELSTIFDNKMVVHSYHSFFLHDPFVYFITPIILHIFY
jgi:hypothetical protein